MRIVTVSGLCELLHDNSRGFATFLRVQAYLAHDYCVNANRTAAESAIPWIRPFVDWRRAGASNFRQFFLLTVKPAQQPLRIIPTCEWRKLTSSRNYFFNAA